jgi:sialate O-acetylesterase
MRPWIGFPLRGAIWYQGEANVHNVELHEILFASLVKSWRQIWGAGFPIYFTQLSSFQSPAWPHFRNSQRKLVDGIERTGMAITTDVGDSLDIHPKRKKQVGERLALWALAREYGSDVEYSGPLFRGATVQQKKVTISFKHADGLRSSDNKPIRSFELAGADKVFKPASATIQADMVVLRSEAVTTPQYVRYGWKPYSDGNLINAAKLPASTFLEELEPPSQNK